MTHLLLTGDDPAADRAVLQALVTFEQATPVNGLPVASRDAWLSRLAAFKAGAPTLADRQQQACERALARLLDEVLAQPLVALHPQLGGAGAGPITADIALLLRRQPLAEDVELDLAVRWWQLARAAGLLVDTDFGACFRLLEWTWLLQQLVQPQPDAASVKVVLRYGPIKPLLLWLEPQSGAAPKAGYTF